MLGARERERERKKERKKKHRNSKDIARVAYRNCCKTLLDRSNHLFFEALERNDDIFRETHLVDAVPCEAFQQQLGADAVVMASTSCMTHVGALKNGHYLHAWVGSSMVLLQAEVFLELRKRFDPRVQFLLIARAYVSQGTGAKSWAPTDGTVCVPVDRVVRRDIVFIDKATGLVSTTV